MSEFVEQKRLEFDMKVDPVQAGQKAVNKLKVHLVYQWDVFVCPIIELKSLDGHS